ncbi:hypothetical protein VA249_12920 [Vibrio alfacsensis]|uniref:hypothetical protein n=1 Tax=Vibrio alfacsensis TaxID=1074311 RepID=UPI001BED428B|nr:hypothetical protein [Vibrio alfacsensis]BBM64646.1 hypothetical protein VA249_12920 [Vibrio alfacsensis]
MNYVVTLLVLSCVSFGVYSDDSESNPLAKKIKRKLQKKVDKEFSHYQGYCDVMIEMEYKSQRAIIKKISGNGDSKVCKSVRSNLRIGKQYRYDRTEKYIRLHITTSY